MSESKTTTRRINDITDKEDKAFKALALHYGVSYKEANTALRKFLIDLVDHNLLEKIDEPVNDEFLGVPINIVNSLARDRFLTNAKPSRSKKSKSFENEADNKNQDKKEKHYPILLKAAARVIELVEVGEKVNYARIREELSCDYSVAKLAMDTIEKLYKPKNPKYWSKL